MMNAILSPWWKGAQLPAKDQTPWLIAESVCGKVARFLDVETPARYAVWIEARAELSPAAGATQRQRRRRRRGCCGQSWSLGDLR
jgi:hypothetical protein